MTYTYNADGSVDTINRYNGDVHAGGHHQLPDHDRRRGSGYDGMGRLVGDAADQRLDDNRQLLYAV